MQGNSISVVQSFTYDLNQTPDISEDVEFSLCDMKTGGVSQESIQKRENTCERVPFIPPSFENTPIDLNVAFEFSQSPEDNIMFIEETLGVSFISRSLYCNFFQLLFKIMFVLLYIIAMLQGI